MSCAFGLILLFFLLGCSTNTLNPEKLYGLEDVEPDLKKYLINENINEPGKVCGLFKNERPGCFALYKSANNLSLFYEEAGSGSIRIKNLSTSGNFVYLTKHQLVEVRSSNALPSEQIYKFDKPKDILLFNYFEKATSAIFWENNKFREVFISD